MMRQLVERLRGRRMSSAGALAATGMLLVPSVSAATPGPAGTPYARRQPAANVAQPVFTNLDMIDTTTGFAWGILNDHYALWATRDGGVHWQRRHVASLPPLNAPGTPFPVLNFDNAQQGWIAWITRRGIGKPGSASSHSVATLTVLHTRDGGRRWSVYHRRVLGVMREVEQIAFLGKNGWIRVFSGGVMNQGDTGLYHTTNNGRSWSLVSAASGYVPNPDATPDALPAMDIPMPMTFTTANDGWVAVGNDMISHTVASLYHTTTAGRRWFRVLLPVPAPLQHNAYTTTEFQPVFASAGDGSVLVQFQGDTHGEVIDYRTTDHGKVWTMGTPFQLKASASPLAMSAISPSKAWVIGVTGGSFGMTQNGGHSWSNLPIAEHLKAVFNGGYRVVSFNMVSSTRGWMLVEAGNQKRFALLRTKDGGHSWGIQRW